MKPQWADLVNAALAMILAVAISALLIPGRHDRDSLAWACILVVGSTLLWIERRHRRIEGRRQRGECLACGYDLRATPRRCPECGAVPAPPAPADPPRGGVER